MKTYEEKVKCWNQVIEPASCNVMKLKKRCNESTRSNNWTHERKATAIVEAISFGAKRKWRLKHEFQQMTTRFNAASVESEKWQQQTEILKLSKRQMNDTEKKAFEKRRNQYVKEIDRCIALWMNSQILYQFHFHFITSSRNFQRVLTVAGDQSVPANICCAQVTSFSEHRKGSVIIFQNGFKCTLAGDGEFQMSTCWWTSRDFNLRTCFQDIWANYGNFDNTFETYLTSKQQIGLLKHQ